MIVNFMFGRNRKQHIIDLEFTKLKAINALSDNIE